MATALDQKPSGTVATVRRPGETQYQQDLRTQGYSDEEIAGATGRGISPLYRAQVLANQRARIANTQSRAQMEQQSKAAEALLNEKKYALAEREFQQKVQDAHNLADQTTAFYNFRDQVAQQEGLNTKNFYAKILAGAGKFPAVINSPNAHVAGMLAQYEKDYKGLGGNPDVVSMYRAIAEINPSELKDPDVQDYIASLPDRYPGFTSDPDAKKMFTGLVASKNAATAEQPQVPPGMVATSQTVKTPAGTMTVQPQNAVDAKAQAGQAKFLGSQLNTNQRILEAAIAKRAQAENKGATKDVLDLLDDHITGLRTSISDTQTQIGQLGKPAPTTVSGAAGNAVIAPGVQSQAGVLPDATQPAVAAPSEQVTNPAGIPPRTGGVGTMMMKTSTDPADYAQTETPPSEWTDAGQVKNEFLAGRLSREQATSILKDQFGHTD